MFFWGTLVLISKLLFDQDKLLFTVARFYSAMQTCLILRLVITSYFRIIQVFSSISGHASVHYVIIILTNNAMPDSGYDQLCFQSRDVIEALSPGIIPTFHWGLVTFDWPQSWPGGPACLTLQQCTFLQQEAKNCTKNVTTDELMTIETILPHTSLVNKVLPV